MSGGSQFSSGGGGTTLSGGTTHRLAKWTAADNIGNSAWAIGSTNGELQFTGSAKGTKDAPLIQLHSSVASGLFISDDGFNRLAIASNGVYCAEFTGGAQLRLYDGTGANNGTYILSSSTGLEIGALASGQSQFTLYVAGSSASQVRLLATDSAADRVFDYTKALGSATDIHQIYFTTHGSGRDQVDWLNISCGGGVSTGGVYKKANGLTVNARGDWTGAVGTTTANSATSITGSSTKFEYQFGIGDYVALSSAATTFARITAIASATSMTVNTAIGDGTSQTFVRRQAPLQVRDRSENGLFYVSPYGDVVIGSPAGAALATDAANGFLFIPTCAGTPTGTPETYTGRVAMVYDTTNNELYIYDGGWVSTSVFA